VGVAGRHPQPRGRERVEHLRIDQAGPERQQVCQQPDRLVVDRRGGLERHVDVPGVQGLFHQAEGEEHGQLDLVDVEVGAEPARAASSWARAISAPLPNRKEFSSLPARPLLARVGECGVA
jgi:hypothetical protein